LAQQISAPLRFVLDFGLDPSWVGPAEDGLQIVGWASIDLLELGLKWINPAGLLGCSFGPREKKQGQTTEELLDWAGLLLGLAEDVGWRPTGRSKLEQQFRQLAGVELELKSRAGGATSVWVSVKMEDTRLKLLQGCGQRCYFSGSRGLHSKGNCFKARWRCWGS